jgi:hypothetical protein
MKDVLVRTKANGFLGEAAKVHQFRVDDDGSISIYDSIARHYVIPRALTERQRQRILSLAAKARDE